VSGFRPFVAGLDPSIDIFEEPRESLMTPAQTANVAFGFADPLGLIDIFGMYPEFPERGVSVEEMAMGPRSPSLLENIQNRDYLNSILQLAGVVPGAAGTSKALRQALRAYHGTPHRFPRGQRVRNKKTGKTYVADLDSPAHQKILESGDFELIGEPSDLGLFDMSRIGQGEGAQAYGRGLYFAEAEEVGKGYRDRLAQRDFEYEDELYRRYKQAEADEDYIRMEMLERAMMHDKPYEFRELAADVDYDEDYREAASRMAEEIEELNPNLGSLYTVDIDVDPDELLDYDIPLSEQSDFVKEAFKKIPRGEVEITPHPAREGYYWVKGNNWRGGKVARIASSREQAERVAAKARGIDLDLEGDLRGGALIEQAPYEQQEGLANMLREAGIKGIKYLDQDSRFVPTLDSGKDLTSNYVIFDDELIKIVDRKREGGAVMQPFVAGLDPTIDIFDDPRDAEPLLTPAQAANVGGGFADPFGMIDIFGGYPAFPSDEMSVEEMLVGPRSPSLMENLRQGEYLDAALQAAGVIPIVGGAAKGIRTARAGIRALPIDKPASRLVEEDITPVNQIKMPIAEDNDELALQQLAEMTSENQPIVQSFMQNVDKNFGTKSSDNIKDPAKVVQKANRPSILEKKPWHNISHVRDTYRFQTELEDFRDIPLMIRDLRQQGISLVKADTDKMFSPKEWGWRMVAFDLRMPNGQIVEWYTPLREMNKQKMDEGHYLFEQWRNKTAAELAEEQDAYYDAIRKSKEGYDRAFDQALDRLGLSRPEAEAEFRKMESSLADAL
jgi:hypothetical protein